MGGYSISDMVRFAPDLLEPPHVLPVLMELFAGDARAELIQQELLIEHLAICHYCRTAVIVLLALSEEYERVNNDDERIPYDLLKRFATISREIDAYEARNYERQGAYAEAIVARGKNEADQLFPDVVAHLSICQDCRAIVDETVSIIRRPEGMIE